MDPLSLDPNVSSGLVYNQLQIKSNIWTCSHWNNIWSLALTGKMNYLSLQNAQWSILHIAPPYGQWNSQNKCIVYFSFQLIFKLIDLFSLLVSNSSLSHMWISGGKWPKARHNQTCENDMSSQHKWAKQQEDFHSHWIFWHPAIENWLWDQKKRLFPCSCRNCLSVCQPQHVCQSQHVFISGPIPTLRNGIKSLCRVLALNTSLTSACLNHWISFTDNFNIFLTSFGTAQAA